MDGTYVPPWRRGQAAGGDSAEASSADCPPRDQAHQNTPHSNRSTYNRGRGRRGNHRGGRGGYQKAFFPKKEPQVDRSDLYSPDDIHNYFWGSNSDARDARSSTFHSSNDRPQELSYALLFFGANPRWADDHIVFAKSKLTLLPEYAVKKAENGEWETENDKHKGVGEATNPVENDSLEDRDATMALHGHKTEIVTQAGETTYPEADTLPCLPAETQNSQADKPSEEEGTAISITATDSAIEDDKSGAKQEATDKVHHIPSHNIITEPPDDNGPTMKKENSKHGEQEDEGVAVQAESAAKLSTRAPPVPSNTMSTSRLKYTDIRKEEEQADSIRTIPADGFYREYLPSSPGPVFPQIVPIDYVPTKQLPIAIFEEQRIPGLRPGGPQARFAFKGWFKISRINILAPKSAELVRMLQQKWERTDSFGNPLPCRPYTTSLTFEWAVIGFELLEGEGVPPPPQIEKLLDSERPVGEVGIEKKSVNELLSDMRLNDGNMNRQESEGLGQGAMLKPDEGKVASEDGSGEDLPASDK
ncbi:hypothetical protein GGS24DRAFT_445187 [Hypoxylon argillaceum]|nr:hypothetical protein GGS24DRAFT_445187 [Hypoxylon argillaceum]